MKFHKIQLLAILTLSVLNFNAYAKTPSFTYVGAEYIANGNFSITDGKSSIDVDLDGFAVNASIELGIFFFQASRFELDTDDFAGGSLEDNISNIAAGLTFELPRSQVYGLVRARHDQIKGTLDDLTENADGTTLGAEAGIRVALTDRIELNANAGIPSTDGGVIYGLGAQFFITNNIGITFDVKTIELEDDDFTAEFETAALGLRFSF